MAPSQYYRDKVAVVTGGASGVGLALAEAMLSYGAPKVVLADINAQNLERETVRLNAAYSGKVAGICCDVTKERDVQSMIVERSQRPENRYEIKPSASSPSNSARRKVRTS
jgi:NAD(P)-dependent dehydrogenase (short-subunit alcohol dehydrogenase family)